MRLIDADALIMALRLEYPMMPMFKENQKEWGIKTEGYRKAEEVIKGAPSIDIVRCKECRWGKPYSEKQLECDALGLGGLKFPNDFCSYGEPNSSEKPNNCEVKNYCDDCLYTDTCDDKAFFYACTSKATISKMEQVDKDINVRSKDEPRICDTCRYYNSNIPCGSTPSACKEADKFAEEFVDGLKKLKPKVEPQTSPTISKMEQVDEPKTQMKTQNSNLTFEKADEPQTERSE